jgi:hypothetical protein
MFMPAPRGLRDPTRVDERIAMLETVEHIQPLREFRDDLISRRKVKQPDIIVPDFDPADAGVNARILLLFEAPGPKTIREWGGSGFISSDNDDQTAANAWVVRSRVGGSTAVCSYGTLSRGCSVQPP